MKNLNPKAGLRQIVSGYFCLPRKIIFELINSKKIKPVELGMFLVFLCSADWHNNQYRNGYVRLEFAMLEKAWNIPKTTLYDHAKILHNKGLLIKELNTYKINDFSRFTQKGALAIVKAKPTDDYIDNIFDDQDSDSEISEQLEVKTTPSFNTSSKVESSIYPKRVCIRQPIRALEEYQRIYEEGNYHSLTPEDMLWIDENVQEIIEIAGEQDEREIVKIYFDGNWNEYKKCLIT